MARSVSRGRKGALSYATQLLSTNRPIRAPRSRGLPSPGRFVARRRQRRDMRYGQASGLSLDLADVPLQRLVLSVVNLGGRRYAYLPALRARPGGLRRARRVSSHASVRRADRDVDAAQRGAPGEARAPADGGV